LSIERATAIDTVDPTESYPCEYCSRWVSADHLLRATPDDDLGWAFLGKAHARDCGWITSRGRHLREVQRNK